VAESIERIVREWFAAVEGPGLGRVTAAADPAVAGDGRLAFTAFTRRTLDEPMRSSIEILDAAGKRTTVGAGQHDRLPRWSVTGALAWLTDDGTPDRWSPAWVGGEAADAVRGTDLPGTAEDGAWSPDGRCLLVVVHADEGAGPTTSAPAPGTPADDWHPTVLRSTAPTGWRSVHIVDPATGGTRDITPPGLTVWEATWCGSDAIAAIVADGPGEETWYSARLVVAPVDSGSGISSRVLATSSVQLGRPAASPSGRRVAVVEAFSSDRSLVAGDLLVGDTTATELRRIDTAGVDVTRCAWRTEDVLCFIGIRGLHTVAGEIDVQTGELRETWVSAGSTSGEYPQAAWSPDGTMHVAAESWTEPPHLLTVRNARESMILDFAHDGTRELLLRAGTIETIAWSAPDGVKVEALLVIPPEAGGAAPHPLVLDIHGGPVWAWRNQYRMGQYSTPLLAALGYAVLLPNPRGSSGRGQAYARLVERDVCGPDTDDFLSGLDVLVDRGIADPARIGVTGTSYGGTMACWLPTQDSRFAAAVPVSGGTDWVSFHFTTDIPDFDFMVLPGDPLDPAGGYGRRSPLTHVAAVQTPVLHLAGARDTCVPVSQAMEFHRALSLRGVESELVVYPREGHGVHDFPAVADAVERTVGWFVRHLPPRAQEQLTP
jgi:dipeptidyl aminopeptidase/acylaminoacyl peptidase